MIANLTSRKETARALRIHERTLDDYLADPALGFPRPVVIRSRKYWDPTEISDWIKRQLDARHQAA